MQLKRLTHSSKASRLLLVFSGWSADWRPFEHVAIAGYDVAVVWDYRPTADEYAPLTALCDQYDEVVVVAWSLGVMVASEFRHNAITRRVAVNGTLRPVDDNLGIPPAIFRATLDGLTAASLKAFRRHIGAGRVEIGPDDVEALRDELAYLGDRAMSDLRDAAHFDVAVISKRDLIFPPDNMRRAWSDTVTMEIDEPHMPDFARLVPRVLIDKDLVAQRFQRVMRSTYDEAASPQYIIAERFWDLIRTDVSCMECREILEIGAGSGVFTRLYAPAFPDAQLTLMDVVDLTPLEAPNVTIMRGDAETLISAVADRSMDLVVSVSTVQWLNSPLQFMAKCCEKVRAGGVVAFSTFAPDNLSKLAPYMSPQLLLPSIEGWLRAVPPGMEVVEATSETIEVRFSSVGALLTHLRDTGVNAVRRTDGEGAAIARRILQSYPTEADGSCTLDYHPLCLILRRLP